MAQSKWYVVWAGRGPGIYETWDECKRQVDGFAGARYKSFGTKQEAVRAFSQGCAQSFRRTARERAGGKSAVVVPAVSASYDENSISVDAASSGNPGIVEYRGVDTKSGELLFHHGPIPKGTNNLGEFLAIVHGLAYLKQQGSDKIIYSDSRTAIKWVRDKQVATTLTRDETTEEIWALVDRALAWLNNNRYSNKIVKWETNLWGEIKADFGRK